VIVVDASIAVKWIVEEPGRREALGVLDAGRELVAPDTIFAEATSVLRRKLTTGEVTHQQAVRGLQGLKTTLARTIAAADLWPDALELSIALKHSAYDCFYLAAAVGRGVLVSADEKFLGKARMAGFGDFVSSPTDLPPEGASAGTDLPPAVLADVRRLALAVQQTFEALREAASDATGDREFSFLPVGVFAPAFASPAYRGLENVLRKLPAEQLACLIALGWLGRPYHGPEDWPALLSNARGMAESGFDRHRSYIMAQMAEVARGLEKVQQTPSAERSQS
jgi:predicted nucleic acid-binding protein